MNKFLSRKFLMSLAAFLGSVGTSITGLVIDNKSLTTVGTVCMILSAGIYAACEAYTDGKRATIKTEVVNNTEQKVTTVKTTE